MFFAPRIDLAGGESLHALPNPEDPERPFEDAAQVALKFQENGARRIQVIDVDRATESGDNDETLLTVLESVGVEVDAGGGVRSMRRIQELLDTGAKRVILSTMGLLHRDWLKEVGLCFGKRVIQAVDLKDGKAWINGRREAAPIGFETFLGEIDGYGLGSILLTPIGGPADRSMAATLRSLPDRLKTPLWAGSVPPADAEIEEWRTAGFEGVVLEKELYESRVDLGTLQRRFNGGPSIRQA